MPFCNKCGYEIAENTKFCPKCGDNQQAGQSPNQGRDTVKNAVVENLSLWEYFLKCFKNYAQFRGRARRKEFWGFALFNWVITSGLLIVGTLISVIFDDEEGTLGTILYFLYSLAAILPGWGVSIRRLHDTGKSGWNLLWSLTIIGAFYVLYLLCLEGEDKENVYGPSPKCGNTLLSGQNASVTKPVKENNLKAKDLLKAGKAGAALLGTLLNDDDEEGEEEEEEEEEEKEEEEEEEEEENA